MADIAQHDDRRIRCRRLGHMVTFRYCRTQEGERLCGSIMDCWWEVFDVRAFLREHLQEETLRAVSRREPRPKLAGLLELAQRAREDGGEPDEGTSAPAD
jgi:hypothetical protein